MPQTERLSWENWGLKVSETEVIPAKLNFATANLKLTKRSQTLDSVRTSAEKILQKREDHVASLRDREQELLLELEQVRSEMRAFFPRLGNRRD